MQLLHWFKQRLSPQSRDSLLVSTIAEASARTEEQFRDQKRGLRRLSLAQQQQGEAMERLERQLCALKSSIDQRQGVVFHYEQIIDLLDRLHRIGTAAQSSTAAASLVAACVEQLLQLSGLEAVAREGEQYPGEGCEVLSALPDRERPPGAVHDIIQQGYRTPAGDLMRTAKVVVVRQPPTTEEETEDTPDEHA